MKEITVRAERPEDGQAVAVVNLSAFGGEEEAKLVEELRSSDAYLPDLSLVAEFNGRIVGHMMLSRALFKGGAGEKAVLVLAPLAVVPSQSHRGIGSMLVEEAVRRAAETGYPAIVETGQAEFYLKLGFTPAAERNLQCNLTVPLEAVTFRELEMGALDAGGKVFYPSQFQSVFSS